MDFKPSWMKMIPRKERRNEILDRSSSLDEKKTTNQKTTQKNPLGISHSNNMKGEGGIRAVWVLWMA